MALEFRTSKGEPGSESWPNEQSMSHGGGMTWMTGTYDPELNLLYWGTGNPNPVHAGQGRKGDNLWTCSIVALNPSTGKLVWWFQASPHDTHDWDNVEAPVLFDGTIDGKPRKLLAQAARNGYFFVLDRTNGKSIVTTPFIDVNWAKGVDAKGQPIPNEEKEPKPDGSLMIPSSGGATNWYPPSFDPETGLFYVSTTPSYSVYYLTDTSKKPEGYGGRDCGVWSESGWRQSTTRRERFAGDIFIRKTRAAMQVFSQLRAKCSLPVIRRRTPLLLIRRMDTFSGMPAWLRLSAMVR